jgi:phosphoglycerol transferase
VLCAAVAGRKVGRNLALVALATLVLFLFGTIGGFGSLFAQVISASIRGWNRISIFIAFSSLFVAFALLDALLRRRFTGKQLAGASMGVAVAVLGVGLFDQTAPACRTCAVANEQAFRMDRDFIGAIERRLPPGSAVYQLPYMGFPEVPHLFQLGTYDLAAGFLQSDTLRWSYAGMKGREGDLFYRGLSHESVARQLDVVGRLGFAGVYVDRRGFEDNGQAIVGELSRLLGQAPALQRKDGNVVFFTLPPVPEATARAVRGATSAAALMRLSGFAVDKLGTRYEATLAQGVDFTRRDVPMFVQDFAGLSGPEPWGRWSDANLAPTVRIDLRDPLPARFVLKLTAQPFGPNAGKDLLVRLGSKTVRFNLSQGVNTYQQAVDLGGERVLRMEIVAPTPVSPQELGMSSDTRKIGVGLIRLAFE